MIFLRVSGQSPVACPSLEVKDVLGILSPVVHARLLSSF
jgi:hypothetical protein